jgi:hypothetical protein
MICIRPKPYKATKPSYLAEIAIPLALSGVNPRTILGKSEWREVAKKAKRLTNYHCKCCGIYTLDIPAEDNLEAHEVYEIDFKAKKATYKKTIPVCTLCHEVIHHRRIMRLFANGKYKKTRLRKLISHAAKLLPPDNPKLLELKSIIAGATLEAILAAADHEAIGEFSSWRLIYKNKAYPPKFPNLEALKAYYAKVNNYENP